MRPDLVTIIRKFEPGYGVRNIGSVKVRLGNATAVAKVAPPLGARVGKTLLR